MAKTYEDIATEITVAYVQSVGQADSDQVLTKLLDKDTVSQFYETVYEKARVVALGEEKRV